MEIIIGLVILWLISKAFLRDSPPPAPRRKANKQTFRPSPRVRSSSSIKFKDSSSSSSSRAFSLIDLDGLHDAFTGAPLNKTLGLHQCQACMVFYHTESLQVLREVNDAKCVSCQSIKIVAFTVSVKTDRAKDYTPNVITLLNYHKHVGSVVTFEGQVKSVLESRRGNDYAVMFENKSWAKGFKLVFFRDAVRKVGGKIYINTLAGKTITVRGLLIKHKKFGYEIVVSEKSMLLSEQ